MGVTLGPTFLLGSTFPPGSALPVPGSAGPPRGLFHLFLPWELPWGCPGAPPAGPVLPVGQEVLFRGSGFAWQALARCRDRDDGVGILLSSLPRCPGRAVPVGAAPWAMPPQCPAENPPKDSVNTCGAAPAAPRDLSLPFPRRRFPVPFPLPWAREKGGDGPSPNFPSGQRLFQAEFPQKSSGARRNSVGSVPCRSLTFHGVCTPRSVLFSPPGDQGLIPCVPKPFPLFPVPPVPSQDSPVLEESIGLIHLLTHVFIPSRDFLPRGSGIVTRRPLILQLIFSKTGTGLENRESIPGGTVGVCTQQPSRVTRSGPFPCLSWENAGESSGNAWEC